MIIPGSKRACQRAGIICRPISAQSGYKTASPGGPAGSANMTFAVVCAVGPVVKAGNDSYLFQRYANGAAQGWYMSVGNSGVLTIGASNATPGFVNSLGSLTRDWRPQVIVARYNSGNMQGIVNGVATTNVTLGAGYLASAVATMIGCQTTNAVFNCADIRIFECVHLDTYDAVATYNSAVFGTGLAGLCALWQEDLQQGRYLTPPHVAGAWTANDHYWSARDVVQGSGTKTPWTDRGPNAVAMTKTGTPVGACMPMVF